MGKVLDRSHTHVQRVEQGTAPISAPDARKWLDATSADSDTREAVLALVAAAAKETVPFRTGSGHLQHEAAARIEAADTVATFQPHVIPGLLQTERYCRALGVPPNLDLEAHVAARMARQDVLTSGRHFEFVIRAWVIDAADDEQQAKLADAHGEDVEIRVLDDRHIFLLATVGFMIYTADGNDTAVRMELPHGEHELRDPNDVAVYRELFTELTHAAKPLDRWLLDRAGNVPN